MNWTPLRALLSQLFFALVLSLSRTGVAWGEATPGTPGTIGDARGTVVFPLDRTAYFVGEKVPVAFDGLDPAAGVTLDAVGADGRTRVYQGVPCPLFIDTSLLAPGEYSLDINGAPSGRSLFLTSPLRRSAGSLQDEWLPADTPQGSPAEQKDPGLRARKQMEYQDSLVRTLRETGLTALVSMGSAEMGRRPILDSLARAGTLMLVNPDTRPTSFFPAGVDPAELDGMVQRMVLTAQANGRYPNFGGFCFGWDTTGHAVGGRKGLLVYWGWGNEEQALRHYIDRQDRTKMAEFTRRTGLPPLSPEDYITYALSIGRPEFAPAIDLPTKLWLEEMARQIQPLADADRTRLEQRVDAWSRYLMGLYRDSYRTYVQALRGLDPSLRHTSSVQIDHCAVMEGQYFPSAYEPLDFRYQSTWNDQVGGPDYIYQWLLTVALLNMRRGDQPIWISNSFGAVHAQSHVPGKFLRVIAHGLAHGCSGAGFALEGFSNLLGGMNQHSTWNAIRDKPESQDVLGGREFLDRFSSLAVSGRGDHGVGILFSQSQYARQYTAMGFGKTPFLALVALTRLGYTPCFLTEEEIAAGDIRGVKAIVILGQTFPLPGPVAARLDTFAESGGRVLADRSTTTPIPNAESLDIAFPFTIPGKPHSWSSPNMARGERDVVLYERWHPELARAFSRALGETGRARFASEKGVDTKTTIMQIDGGRDATYLVAVNDSHVRTHCDWHQVKECLLPVGGSAAEGWLYDATEEKPLGRVQPFECDLTATTARVYAILPQELKSISLAANQSIAAGRDLAVEVGFLAGRKKRLEAVVPFHLAVIRPDGKVHQEFYRATSRAGAFAMRIPVPANAPEGTWSVRARCQLNGEWVSIPVKVRRATTPAMASPWRSPVLTREPQGIPNLLSGGAKVVLPLFDSPQHDALLPIAESIKASLAPRGVTVDIRVRPELTTYWLAYDPTEEQRKENDRANQGETIGRIKRTTVNGNDWYSGMSGYRFGMPMILLDLAGEKDNEMAEALDRCGILWPQVSQAFPGKGRGVIQMVHWAFGPRAPAIVLQAADIEGLKAVAQALLDPPADALSPGIQAARASLFHECHAGGAPETPQASSLTSRKMKHGNAPQPFILRFTGEKPMPADQAKPPEPYVHPAHPVPGTLEPKQFVTFMRDGDRYIEATSPGGDWPRDLRFSQALLIVADVARAGKVKWTAEGQFRYSDRRPRSQPQWEDLLAIRDRVVSPKRVTMEMEVQLGGKALGRLVSTKTGEREVQIETLPFYVKAKPKSVVEEVVLELAGETELPAGRQELLLIPRHIVDGVLNKLYIGVEPPAPPAQ